MLAQYDRFRTGHKLLRIELRKKRVCRRAIGTAFRSKKLYKYRYALVSLLALRCNTEYRQAKQCNHQRSMRYG